MNKFKYLSKISLLFYFFFYLIFTEHAIARNKDNIFLIKLENSLNNRNFSLLNQYFAPEDWEKFSKKLNKLIEEFPDAKWKLSNFTKKSTNKNIVDIKLNGSKSINGKKFFIHSDYNFLFSFINGKIQDTAIKNNLTLIRNDMNKIDISIAIPDKVLTGAKYDIDVIVNEPLGESIIAGNIREHSESNILPSSIDLEPLASGGIFKVTRAPIKPGIQIWSGMIAHPKGLISFTKTVNIQEKF